MKIFQVDAFTDSAFKGNPAAVCFPKADADANWMQAFAAEMNLSETAFLWQLMGNRFHLRWFTPAVEVDLCGHATLASSHVLFTEGFVQGFKEVNFETRSGLLPVRATDKGLEMDFPSVEAKTFQPSAALSACFKNRVADWYQCGENIMLVTNSEANVLDETPDFSALRKMSHFGYIITARSSDPLFDFVSRYFAPAQGVDEDPVTGSAHCSLAPFWAERLGKNFLKARQISKRGGVLELETRGQRVMIRGTAVTILQGEVLVN